MRKTLIGMLTCLIVTGANANPPSDTPHSEKDFRPIGGGLLVSHDEMPKVDSDGNTTVLVFSRGGIKA